jgi:radical SAM superfamily enzyme
MAVFRCANGNYKIGDGECIYETRAAAEQALQAQFSQTREAFEEDQRSKVRELERDKQIKFWIDILD